MNNHIANFNGDKPTIDPNDTALLLIDHQSGLFQVVKDIDLPQLRANAIALAKAANLLQIPVITTASVPQGPNGPLIPEIHAAAPHATYVAGTITSVCLAFPCISAIYEGYKVFAVVDASGTVSQMASDLTIARLTQAGVVPVDTMGTISELQGTWNRPDAEQWAEVYAQAMPHYQLLIESHTRAQQAARDNEVLDSQRS